MNIFVTDTDPIVAAQNLCDKHVRSKMQIEGAIMLSNAFTQEMLNNAPRTKTGNVRKTGKGYSKHQCTVWVKESRDNFMWLVEHTLEMFTERMYRWPQSVEHFTKEFIEWCKDNKDNTIHKLNTLTPFVTAINDSSTCCNVDNFRSLPVVEQYRLYIKHDKPFAIWTNRQTPCWYNS